MIHIYITLLIISLPNMYFFFYDGSTHNTIFPVIETLLLNWWMPGIRWPEHLDQWPQWSKKPLLIASCLLNQIMKLMLPKLFRCTDYINNMEIFHFVPLFWSHNVLPVTCTITLNILFTYRLKYTHLFDLNTTYLFAGHIQLSLENGWWASQYLLNDVSNTSIWHQKQTTQICKKKVSSL